MASAVHSVEHASKSVHTVPMSLLRMVTHHRQAVHVAALCLLLMAVTERAYHRTIKHISKCYLHSGLCPSEAPADIIIDGDDDYTPPPVTSLAGHARCSARVLNAVLSFA